MLWSALARIGLKRKRGDEQVSPVQQETPSIKEEISFATWYSGGKGDGMTPQLNGARYFSFEELKMSTNNFSESNVIGEGGFGKVYKGYLTNGVIIAIKRAKSGSSQGIKEFKNEIELLSRVHHRNVVSLVGFCFEQGEQMLVYEYISKESLDKNLSGKTGTCLDWKQRLQIALDVSRGLSYLHDLANPQIIHGDPKSSNILLDENLNAKVTDFALSKVTCEKKEVYLECPAGTLACIDPAFLSSGQLSEKSDVYSFGVVMLKLITARSPMSLPYEARKAFEQYYDSEYCSLRDMIDPNIVNQVGLGNIGLRDFVQLAIACTDVSPSNRPIMCEVMKEIENILQN